MNPGRREAILAVLGGLGALGTAAGARSAEAPQQSPPINVRARKYSYSPSRIEVREGDLVTIRLETDDIPHSFTVDDDAYRIAKRAAPGRPVTFEFRAEKAGSFPFYCNLSADEGCRKMRGELVVSPGR